MQHATTITITARQRKLLTQAREAAGLDQGELASRVGCSRNMVCQIERGRKAPSWGLLCAMCRVLGLAVELHIGNAKAPAPLAV